VEVSDTLPCTQQPREQRKVHTPHLAVTKPETQSHGGICNIAQGIDNVWEG